MDHLESPQFDALVRPSPHSATHSLTFDYVHEQLLGASAIVVHDLLSGEECEQLKCFMDLYDREAAYSGEVTMTPATPSLTHRNNQRVCVSSDALSEVLLTRLTPVLASLQQDIITCTEDNAESFLNKGFGMQGTWRVHSLNSRFRLCKYHTGGHFGPHYDSDFVVDPLRKRSLKTFMLYLNDSYEGGETNFVTSHDLHFDENAQIYCSPSESVFASLKAKRGDCLVFDHHLLHEGHQVIQGEKYIIRTDLMYEKDPCEETPQKEEALAIYLEGVRLEEDGLVDAAIQKYRKAFKMCPEIEDAYS